MLRVTREITLLFYFCVPEQEYLWDSGWQLEPVLLEYTRDIVTLAIIIVNTIWYKGYV